MDTKCSSKVYKTNRKMGKKNANFILKNMKQQMRDNIMLIYTVQEPT